MIAKDDRKNAEGYNDPTAYNAIKNVEQEQDKDDMRFHQLLNTLFSLCELADFHIEGRVVLKDKRTGKVWGGRRGDDDYGRITESVRNFGRGVEQSFGADGETG